MYIISTSASLAVHVCVKLKCMYAHAQCACTTSFGFVQQNHKMLASNKISNIIECDLLKIHGVPNTFRVIK